MAQVSPANDLANDTERQPTQSTSRGELFLLCGALVSLIASCILWSLRKQAWTDEIMTWREVCDPSLWHLYAAIQHGADGGMPLFYTTAWLWAKAFGTGVLTLRLYSCVAMCAALLITWRVVRRFYGVGATAFGVLAFWGISGVMLDQNAEARFYGLFMLTVALAVDIYARLAVQHKPKPTLHVLSLLTQAALVLTHVLGIFFSGLILLALICSDAAKRRFRPKTYLFHAGGWLALLVWIPAIRASMAAGKPHGWILMPEFKYLISAYLFAPFQQPFLLLERHSHEPTYRTVHHGAELLMLIPLGVIFLLGLKKFLLTLKNLVTSRDRATSNRSIVLPLVAYLLLSMPVVLFVLSHLITPVFVLRYLLPSGIGLVIVVADFAETLRFSSPSPLRRFALGALTLFFMFLPLLSASVLPPMESSWRYLDVQRLDHVVPPEIPIVADWQDDFAKLMRYSRKPQQQYFFLLDWPAALAGPRLFVVDYHLMSAYRDAGYYSHSIQNSDSFLCSYKEFVVLDTHLNEETLEGPSWFDLAIRTVPQFEWKVLDSFDGDEVKRKLISVRRKEPLSFCRK